MSGSESLLCSTFANICIQIWTWTCYLCPILIWSLWHFLHGIMQTHPKKQPGFSVLIHDYIYKQIQTIAGHFSVKPQKGRTHKSNQRQCQEVQRDKMIPSYSEILACKIFCLFPDEVSKLRNHAYSYLLIASISALSLGCLGVVYALGNEWRDIYTFLFVRTSAVIVGRNLGLKAAPLKKSHWSTWD